MSDDIQAAYLKASGFKIETPATRDEIATLQARCDRYKAALEAAEVTILLVLSAEGIPADTLEMLTLGDGRGTVAPGSLKRAVAAITIKALEDTK